jgi:biopolymer transport protein ExbD
MKIRKNAAAAGPDKIDINMTPMIDIVFQLLSFFIMSFKIVAMEGDFNVKMPLAAQSTGQQDSSLPPLTVALKASPSGDLAKITLDQNDFGTNFQALHNHLAAHVGQDTGPARDQYEVEFDCDYNLKYENVVNAITAVSGSRDKNGHIIKLIEKIKFKPPRQPGT